MRATLGSCIAAFVASTSLSVGLFGATTHAAEPTPGYNNKIPESIMTPDKVETKVGTLEFFDGIPTEKTAALLYDSLDYIRGVETFLSGMPAASLEAIRRGQAALGAKTSNQVMIMDQLMDSNSLFLTGNTDTVYCSAFLDLKKHVAQYRKTALLRHGVLYGLYSLHQYIFVDREIHFTLLLIKRLLLLY